MEAHAVVIAWVTIGVFLVCALGEWAHGRRVARVGRLAFGARGRAFLWAAYSPALRTLACAALAWGLLTLYALDGSAPAKAAAGEDPMRRLVICLDVSPSMYIEDAGPEKRERRSARAAELLRSILDRVNPEETRVSVIAFYNGALPVVVDTIDVNVAHNIIDGLPLEHAFEPGDTDLFAGVKEALSIARAWPADSTALVVVSDGDTIGAVPALRIPPAVSDTLVIGVGDPFRATQIAGKGSRQDAQSLKRLALRLGGAYHDGNTEHVPSPLLRGLSFRAMAAPERRALRVAALAASGAGAGVIALLPPALAVGGGMVRHERRNKRKETDR